uniref:Uncharacterized protein n=1 Tax=Zooxanthella nutricula TaxID=1333877 RepID=A0A7S2KJA9_9DINO
MGAWVNMILFQCMFVFTLLLNWRMTWTRLEKFRAQIHLERGVRDWVAVTQEYHALDQFVDELWRYRNFGTAVVAFLAMSFSSMLSGILVGVSCKEVTWEIVYFSWASLHAAFLVTSLFAMASISSRCRSRERNRESIFYMSMQHFGRVPTAHRLDHEIFVKLVQWNPVGVECGPLGRITMHGAAIVFRILIVLLPSAISFASI